MKTIDNIDCWPAQMRSLFDTAGGYDTLHKGCTNRFPEEKWKCMFPEYYADIITTPTFLLNSLYDSSEIWSTLGLNCCLGSGHCRSKHCTAAETNYVLTLRDAHMNAWAPLVNKAGNGVWAPACIIHTMTWGKWTDSKWEVPASSGNTMAAVVQRWLESGATNVSLYQDVVWPNNHPCAPDAEISREESVSMDDAPKFV